MGLGGTEPIQSLTIHATSALPLGERRPADGMRANQKLPHTNITPTTKAFDAGHDEELTAERIQSDGLLTEAQSAGCITVDGLGMLLHQAVPAFERWFGTRPEVDAATRAAVLA